MSYEAQKIRWRVSLMRAAFETEESLKCVVKMLCGGKKNTGRTFLLVMTFNKAQKLKRECLVLRTCLSEQWHIKRRSKHRSAILLCKHWYRESATPADRKLAVKSWCSSSTHGMHVTSTVKCTCAMPSCFMDTPPSTASCERVGDHLESVNDSEHIRCGRSRQVEKDYKWITGKRRNMKYEADQMTVENCEITNTSFFLCVNLVSS